MSLADLPKLWTEPTKIGHIFRKQSTSKIKVFKKFHLQKLISSNILYKKNFERVDWFLMPKNYFECTNFVNCEEVVHNFGRSDDGMI